MSTSGASTTSASDAAKNFFSKTQVIYLFNFLQNLIVAAVVTAVYTSIMVKNGQTPSLNQVNVPIDPNLMTNITYDQAIHVLDSALTRSGYAPNVIVIPDANVAGYDIELMRKFLNESGPIDVPYRLEAFDCDDFALVMLGREREWFGRMSPEGTSGSTFAYISGDLRLNNETQMVGHAMNVFIDNYQEVWLIEPQNRSIYKANQLSQNSRIDYIIM